MKFDNNLNYKTIFISWTIDIDKMIQIVITLIQGKMSLIL